MKNLILICCIVGMSLWSACDCSPLFPVEPELEFVNISPLEVQELQDSIVITLRFRDGDGDIRSQDSTQEQFSNLEVKDLRPTLADSVAKIFYKFPEYSTNTCNPSIQGIIRIEVSPTLIFPRNLQTQKTAFSVRLRDAAGNWSNTTETDSITIIR
jgi:hypothetical protein